MYLKGQRLNIRCFNYHVAALISNLHTKKEKLKWEISDLFILTHRRQPLKYAWFFSLRLNIFPKEIIKMVKKGSISQY